MQRVRTSRQGLLCCVIVAFGMSPTFGQSTIYVNHTAGGENNGSSWTDAYVFLQDALAVATSGDEIWVAEGTYRPDQGAGILPGNRLASFELSSGVALLGGFSGYEDSRDLRNYTVNITTLSGDLNQDDILGDSPFGASRNDNSLHIVRIEASVFEPAPTLDGFVIEKGNANAPDHKNGGGLIIEESSHTILSNLTFRDNFACRLGGALASRGTFELTDSSFQRNRAGEEAPTSCGYSSLHAGGAVVNWAMAIPDEIITAPSIKNVHFEANYSFERGGALAAFYSSVNIANSTFVGNVAGAEGGAIYSLSTPPEETSIYVGVAFVGNRVSSRYYGLGGAISIDRSTIEISNALFNGNAVEDLSEKQGLGGAIAAFETETIVTVYSSTFVNNTASRGSAIQKSSSADLTIWNSIVWDNSTSTEAVLLTHGPEFSVGSSVVQGGLMPEIEDLGGILEADPRFANPMGLDGIIGTVDDDYSLAADSPAIDAGRNSQLPTDDLDLDTDGDLEELLPYDLAGQERIQNGGSGQLLVDLGAYEFGAFPDAIVREEGTFPPDACEALIIYPNPATRFLFVRSPLGASFSSHVSIYNVLGERLYFDRLHLPTNGPYDARIDLSRFTSGMYVLTLKNYESGTNQICTTPFVVSR